MRKRIYFIVFNLYLLVMLLSNLGVMEKLDKKVNNYTVNVGKSIIYSFTKANWQYGFFTGEGNFGYMAFQITLMDSHSGDRLIINNKNAGKGYLLSSLNYIRTTTLFPTMFNDSMYLEACTKSLALNLFNRYPKYDNLQLTVLNNEMIITQKSEKFTCNYKVDTLINRKLFY